MERPVSGNQGNTATAAISVAVGREEKTSAIDEPDRHSTIGQYDAEGEDVIEIAGDTMTEERNRQILERRRAGDSVAGIARDFGVSAPRVRQILKREEPREIRRNELLEAGRRPDQPNALHLAPKLRAKLGAICKKDDFTPSDIEALEFTQANFLRSGLVRADWLALVKWMEQAGMRPIATHRMSVRERLEYDAGRSGELRESAPTLGLRSART